LLKPRSTERTGWQDRLVDAIDRVFASVRRRYERSLSGSLDHLPVTATFAVLVLGSIYFLYTSAPSELAPQEDQGVIISSSTPAPNATLQQRLLYSREVYKIFSAYPETDHVFQIDSPAQTIAGMVLKPWAERSRTSNQLSPVVQQNVNGIAGVHVGVFQLPSLPGAQGLPVQFVINTTDSFAQLNEYAQKFLDESVRSGKFIFADSDLKIDRPQSTVEIDRDNAAQLCLKMSDVGSALAGMLGGGYVNYFGLAGRSYKVMPQVEQRFRLNTDQLLNYYVHDCDGTPVPLSTIARISTHTIPESLNHFQQLNAATIVGVPAPGLTQGDALDFLRGLAAQSLPQGYSIDYGGLSRQYVQESSGFVLTFAFALVIIFLSLAALFESFRDPLIILVSVPMSIAGALIFITVGLGLNIYTQVGLVTLMGLISKHGILIVEFANELQMRGKSKREAIELAAGIRLRPILMTTAAMVLGVIPLIFASGAGAVSRFDMGVVIASGIAIGTLFTLFVVPAVYLLIAADHSAKGQAQDEPRRLGDPSLPASRAAAQPRRYG
jgi:multidrug efflux pump